jgi:hypothetical protein
VKIADAETLCIHDKGNFGAKPKGDVIAEILSAIKERGA